MHGGDQWRVNKWREGPRKIIDMRMDDIKLIGPLEHFTDHRQMQRRRNIAHLLKRESFP